MSPNQKIKVLHISNFDNGGAGIAAVRLHKGLLNINIESKILVLEKRTGAPEIYQYETINKYKVLFQRILKNMRMPQTLAHANDNKYRSFEGQFEYFSFAKTDFTELASHPLVKDCDVVNLHWVANFLDYESFFKNIDKPVVWTMHDMNAFQGGFHYKEDLLNNKQLALIDNEQYQLKLKAISALSDTALQIVSPSKWMMEEAGQSEILGRFKQCHIPNGIDPQIFKPKDVSALQATYGANSNKLKVLFVAENLKNTRKGYQFIQELTNDPEINSKCDFFAVGKFEYAKKEKNINYLGAVNSELKICDIYNLADIYLLPSKEDNLPNVMLESLAVGTPVVGFYIGGVKDLVHNGVNGYLSEEVSTEGLKVAMLKCIQNISELKRDEIAANLGRNYSISKQAKLYEATYRAHLNSDNH